MIRDASFALVEPPSIERIIGQLITTGSLSMFFGDPDTKRIYYSMLSIAICVALMNFLSSGSWRVFR